MCVVFCNVVLEVYLGVWFGDLCCVYEVFFWGGFVLVVGFWFGGMVLIGDIL